MGEGRRPGAIDLKVRLDIVHQVPAALAGRIAGARIRAVPKGSLDRIGTGAVRGQRKQRKARMDCEPLHDRRSGVTLGLVRHEREVGTLRGRVGTRARIEQVQKEPGGFALL